MHFEGTALSSKSFHKYLTLLQQTLQSQLVTEVQGSARSRSSYENIPLVKYREFVTEVAIQGHVRSRSHRVQGQRSREQAPLDRWNC